MFIVENLMKKSRICSSNGYACSQRILFFCELLRFSELPEDRCWMQLNSTWLYCSLLHWIIWKEIFNGLIWLVLVYLIYFALKIFTNHRDSNRVHMPEASWSVDIS
jgi:hypothetical protein